MKDISELAKLYNVTPRTIRYYEELGLLAPKRTETNRRIYPKSEEVKMKLIVRGKKYGFTLTEIKEMVLLFDKDRTGKIQLERTIEYGQEKIAEVNNRIVELQQIKQEMEDVVVHVSQKLEKDLNVFEKLAHDPQTIEAKGLIERMAVFYEGVVALEWADKQGGDYTKFLEIFVEENWLERTIGEEKSSVKYFDEVMT